MGKAKLLNSIQKGVKRDSIEILSQDDRSITIFNLEDGKETQYVFSDAISEECISDKIILSNRFKAKYSVDISFISKCILKYMGKESVMTLKHIFFLYTKSDMAKMNRMLYGNNRDMYYEWGEFSEELGKMLYYSNSCVINLRTIEKNIKKQGVFLEELEEGMTNEIYISLFHELRHLMLETNLLHQNDAHFVETASEKNVELYAVEMFERMQAAEPKELYRISKVVS